MDHLVPRQGIYSAAYSDCTAYDYNAVYNCVDGFDTGLPTCYDYDTDNNCCTSWVNWEEGALSCLETAYDSCFDFYAYTSSIADIFPCYTNNPFAAPQSVAAQTTPVPTLVLEPISTGPPTAAPTHSPIPSYSGQGNLLVGYCATPDYVLLDGPTAYWAPLVGCVNEKSDCCPYAVQSGPSTSATTITVVSTITMDVGPDGATQAPYAGLQAYPTPVSSNQAILANCPGDYISVSGGCCPSGYQLWNAPLGGEVPCYSSLNSYLVPPAVPVSSYNQQITLSANITEAAASSSTTEPNQKPTSAIVNIVYAVQFPVQPSSGLSTGAKVGVGVGAGLGGVAIVVLSLLLLWRTRKHKKDKQTLTAMQQAEGQVANDQSKNGMSEATSPYAYSQRTELQADGTPQVLQTPGGFVPQEQNGYFQQQQMQQTQIPQYYGQQPGQQMQQGLAQGDYTQQPGQQMQPGHAQQPTYEMQGQSPAQYPSPVASTVSPQPTGSDGYGHQTGYAGTIPSSTGSPPPPYQTGYAAPVAELSPNSAGYSAPGSTTYVSPNTTGSPAPGEGYGYQGGYNPTGNGLHHPQAQELNAQNPPGEMPG